MPEGVTDPGKFIAPRLYVSDGTIERFGELLQARPQGILRLTDELSAMFTNMSRYNGGQDNEFWLEAWNGHSYKVERVGRTLANRAPFDRRGRRPSARQTGHSV